MLVLFLLLILVYLLGQVLYTWHYFGQSTTLIKRVFVGNNEVGDRNNPVFKISIYGDSVGSGVAATSFETSLGGRITHYFSDNFFVKLNNYSVVGNKMADVLKHEVPTESQDLIVLVVGSNNLFRLTDLGKFEKDTRVVLKKFSSHAKKIILIGPGKVVSSPAIPIFIKPVYLFKGPKYAAILKKECGKYSNVAYVNPLKPPKEAVKHRPATLAEDKFHPNDAGHEFWFDLVKSAF